MAQSLSNVLLHLVFSTKLRQAWIDPDIERELFPYLATICKDMKCTPHKIGGADDHVHVACSLGRTKTIADLVQELKQSSSKWIKSKGPQYHEFAWQNGYGAFSVGQSQLDALRRYIANQREHHRRVSFQEEFRELLVRYEIEFDERYVWD
jgi:REP element-mobilizing transposase RayT